MGLFALAVKDKQRWNKRLQTETVPETGATSGIESYRFSIWEAGADVVT